MTSSRRKTLREAVPRCKVVLSQALAKPFKAAVLPAPAKASTKQKEPHRGYIPRCGFLCTRYDPLVAAAPRARERTGGSSVPRPHPRAQNADALDLKLDDVSGFQPAARVFRTELKNAARANRTTAN